MTKISILRPGNYETDVQSFIYLNLLEGYMILSLESSFSVNNKEFDNIVMISKPITQ